MKTFLLISFYVLLLLFTSCKSKQENVDKPNQVENIKAKITFLELGSVTCIPCKQMQPIMKSIEEKYKGQVKVVFHDVWKDNAPAKKYNIKLIPTQVFLDENGNEFFRHEGFYPEEEIDKLFQSKGVKAGI